MFAYKTFSSPLRVLNRAIFTSVTRSYYKHKCTAWAKNMRLPQTLNGQLKRHYSSADVMTKTQTQDEEIKAFNDVFPSIVDVLTKDYQKRNLLEIADWMAEIMHYTVPHGNQIRGLGVVNAYQMLVPDASEKQRHISRIVGWCLEMVNAYFIVTDDILDESITRRGQPCWHRKDYVGLKAINDSMMVTMGIFKILNHYIEDAEVRANIKDCITETMWLTSGGQGFESLASLPDGRPDWSKCSLDRYYLMIKFKTGYYTMCAPMQLSLILAGKKQAYTKSVEDLLLDMGSFIQLQNDYLDVYADPRMTAKIGTDIKEGKCSWSLVSALQMVNSEDKEILKNNYGYANDESAQKVIELYNRIGLKDIYVKTEEELYKNSCKRIEVVSKESNIPKDVFYLFLNKLYKFQSHIFNPEPCKNP